MADIGGSSFEALVSAFSLQVAELRESCMLRCDDATRQLYAPDLEAIEATVRALELKLRDVRVFVKREKEAIPQVEAVVEACQLQRAHLQHIAGHLPAYLPSLASPAVAGTSAGGVLQNSAPLRELGAAQLANQHASAGSSCGQAAAKKRPSAPRRFINSEELEGVSSYMRGRLTAAKVNAALDEIAGMSEVTAAMVAAARRNRATGPDKKHAQWLAFNIGVHEALKGRFWVLENDLRAGVHVRLDKTGKALMQLLRHLGRLTEVRVAAEGSTHLVYLLM